MARNIYAISDIHGQFDTLMEMMYKICFGTVDELYFLGDVIDRTGNQMNAWSGLWNRRMY